MSDEPIDVLAALDRVDKLLEAQGAFEAADYIKVARQALVKLLNAASALTVVSDGRGYFESGAACERFREALAGVSAPRPAAGATP